MKTRILHTKTWDDDFVTELSPLQKLLFIYYITNDKIGLTGMYELTDKRAAFDTGLTKAQITEAKAIFQKAGKIFFKDSWIYVVNASKLSGYVGEKLKKAIEKEIVTIPEAIYQYLNTLSENHNTLSDVEDGVSTKSDTPINNKSKIINHKSEDGVVKGKEKVDMLKTSKNSHTPCTSEELQQVSKDLQVSLRSVQDVHQSILDKIEAGEFKHRTVYYTLRDWIRLNIKKGYIKIAPKENYTAQFLPKSDEKLVSQESIAEFRKKRETLLEAKAIT